MRARCPRSRYFFKCGQMPVLQIFLQVRAGARSAVAQDLTKRRRGNRNLRIA
jgi:hypothetical protein